MIDTITIDHHIQRHILSVLMQTPIARFRDMRPPKVDSNLYSYHLGLLLKKQLIDKHDSGYSLSKKGIVYIDRVSTATLDVRLQPKITTMFVIQNDEGEVLLFERIRHPFIGQWALPNGKVHLTDRTLELSAKRELSEKLNVSDQPFKRAGACFIRTVHDGEVVMSTLAHIFTFTTNDIELHDRLRWVKPHKLHQLQLAPAVEQIVARTFFNDPYFFEEYEENW